MHLELVTGDVSRQLEDGVNIVFSVIFFFFLATGKLRQTCVTSARVDVGRTQRGRTHLWRPNQIRLPFSALKLHNMKITHTQR